MSERFIMDDCGTLIDMETRTTYDYVGEVCPVLNEQDAEIQRLKLIIDGLRYALWNIRQIDVEIDLNECGDVE